jgi:hypothetical protein
MHELKNWRSPKELPYPKEWKVPASQKAARKKARK